MNPHLAKRSIIRAAALEFAVPAAPPAPIEVRCDEPPAPPAPDPAALDAAALRGLLTNLTKQVHEWQARRMQHVDDVAHLGVEVAIAVAERLLCTEIAADRQRLDRVVQSGIARLRSPAAVTVHAHPEDVALLQKQLADAEMSGVTLHIDGSLARGQVRLDAGDLFVAWDTAACLAELRTILLDEIVLHE